MSECPKCQAPYSDGEIDCKGCGIVFAKYEKVQAEQERKRAELMTACNACQKEISKNAGSCPHCGEPAQTNVAQEQKKKFKNKLTKSEQRNALIGLFVFLAIFFYFALNGDDSASTKPRDLSSMAFVQCQNFIKSTLKSPSTADFPTLDYESNVATDNLYIIRSYVDAQNDFGATVRTNWRCKARYIGGEDADQRNWNLVDLQMYKR